MKEMRLALSVYLGVCAGCVSVVYRMKGKGVRKNEGGKEGRKEGRSKEKRRRRRRGKALGLEGEEDEGGGT